MYNPSQIVRKVDAKILEARGHGLKNKGVGKKRAYPTIFSCYWDSGRNFIPIIKAQS
jgi:hypothetical protein